MEQEVEILEPNRENKELATVVGIRSFENPGMIVVVDGQGVPAITYTLHCNVCGRVVHSFNQPGLNFPQVIELVGTNKDKLLNIASYCPKCGHKLSYDMGMVDCEVTEHRHEDAVVETTSEGGK